MSTSNSKSVDQFRIVVAEDNIGNLGATILVTLGLFTVKLITNIVGIRCAHPLRQLSLDDLSHVIFEGQGGGFSSISAAICGVVIILFPVLVVLFVDLEADGVVAGCDSGDVPLELLNLSTLIHLADGDEEKKDD